MNEIVKVFNGNPVRIIEKDSVPWFVAKDVCGVLEISKYRDALSRLDEDERGSVKLDTLGGAQEMSIVNEAGLYSLIFRSRKMQAKAFKRWVTHEVLPSIRKTGAYLSPAMTDVQMKTLISTLEEEVYRRIDAESRLVKMERRVEELAVATLDKEVRAVLRQINTLSLCGNIAPMLGLLGTVTGMVDAFMGLGTAMGPEKASILAISISQALYTTAAGLLVAVPAITFSTIFRNLLEKRAEDVSEAVEQVLEAIPQPESEVHRPVYRTTDTVKILPG